MSIARNYIFDLFRKKRTENKFVTSYNPPVETDESANVATMLDVEVALSKLKGSYRQVIILRYVENLSIREVAEVLGWGEDKVRNTTHLAMTELRKLLKNDPEEEDKNEIRTSSFRTT
jgi:RNA polymerase sigma-70 factor (ECF subfamily)